MKPEHFRDFDESRRQRNREIAQQEDMLLRRIDNAIKTIKADIGLLRLSDKRGILIQTINKLTEAR